MAIKFGDFYDQMRDGIASAAYNAIFFGESFKDATAQILRGMTPPQYQLMIVLPLQHQYLAHRH